MNRVLYLRFYEQPQVGEKIEFSLYLPFGVVVFNNSLNKFNVTFGNSTSLPFTVALGADLDATLNNLVSFLNSTWSANFTNALNQNATVSYTRVNDTIAINITGFVRIWGVKTSATRRYIMTGESPCLNFILQNNSPIFLSPTTPQDPNLILGLTGGYNLYSFQDFTNTLVAIPGSIDAEFSRGFTMALNPLDNPDIVTSFQAFASLNFAPFVSDNNITIPILPVPFAPENAFLFRLNNGSWQLSNFFQNVPLGENFIFVRDVFGCEKRYTLFNSGQSNIEPVEPNIYFSESNSVRVVARGGRCNIYNTLSFEENQNVNYKWVHRFSLADAVVTQFKTSYQDISVNIGSIQKVQTNIGVEDIRDAIYFTNEGFLSFRFESGNIYAPDGVTVVDSYVLNGNLPEWAKANIWVTTPFGLTQITSIQTLPNGNEIAITSIFTEITQQTGVIRSTYNREQYDVYEHTLLMGDVEGQINLKFIFGNDEVAYVSECIELSEIGNCELKINWKNSKNTDVFFASEIEFLGYFNEFLLSELADGEVEILKTDSKVFTIRNRDYKAVELQLFGLTTGIARKMKLALKHDVLKINDLFYKLAADVEIEKLGFSNMYTLTAKLIESGEPFTTLGVESPFVGEVPRLLETDNLNYIKI